jgi:hypothetical protein
MAATIAQESRGENCTLWIGHVEPFMDEAYLLSVFGQEGPVVNVKIVREIKGTKPAAYGFIEYSHAKDAEKMLARCTGSLYYGKDGYRFRLNYASHTTPPRSEVEKEGTHLYVGNLSPNVRDCDLMSVFNAKYPSLSNAKVIHDPRSGVSRGFGFLNFRDPSEAQRCLYECPGLQVLGKVITVKNAVKQPKLGGWIGPAAERPESSTMLPSSPPPVHPAWPAPAHWSVPCVPAAQPAITNLTSTQAQMQAWQLLGGAQELSAETCALSGNVSVGLGHFQALLQHPLFVQAFEQQLQKDADSKDCPNMSDASDLLSPLFNDRTDSFGRRADIVEANMEFLDSVSLDTFLAM